MIAIVTGLLSNKWVMGAAAGLGIFLAVWCWAFYEGKASVDIPAIERAAFAKGQIDRNTEWLAKLAAAARDKDAAIEEWQRKAEEAEAASPTPTTAPEIAKLCALDSLCRK